VAGKHSSDEIGSIEFADVDLVMYIYAWVYLLGFPPQGLNQRVFRLGYVAACVCAVVQSYDIGDGLVTKDYDAVTAEPGLP
jgi:hypothetical protein